jgi:hypothetical protein
MMTSAAVSGTAMKAPAIPHTQLQNARAVKIATGESERLHPCNETIELLLVGGRVADPTRCSASERLASEPSR